MMLPYGLPELPGAAEMEQIAEPWRRTGRSRACTCGGRCRRRRSRSRAGDNVARELRRAAHVTNIPQGGHDVERAPRNGRACNELPARPPARP